ncbi:MAG: ribokinase [Chloroflexota bacterium]|nr:ribokinase [Chloroflexota bacterium]
MPPKITVIGSLNIDLVVQAPRMPAPGETIAGHGFHTVPGGKGANQAVAAAKLGAQVTMVGRVGDDSFGRMQRRSMEALGIRTDFLITDEEAPTGTALIIVDTQGQNSIVVIAGANGQLTPDDVEAARPAIEASDGVLLQLEIPIPTVQRAVEVARELDVPVILNPAPAPSKPPPASILQSVDYLIPNEFEAAALSGFKVTDQRSAERAATHLRAQGIEVVILTLGAQGALAISSQGMTSIPAFSVEVVDTTAAGDAFVAAFGVAVCEGQPLTEALRFANAAGALTTTKLGAQPSLPSREKVEAFLQEVEREI